MLYSPCVMGHIVPAALDTGILWDPLASGISNTRVESMLGMGGS